MIEQKEKVQEKLKIYRNDRQKKRRNRAGLAGRGKQSVDENLQISDG